MKDHFRVTPGAHLWLMMDNGHKLELFHGVLAVEKDNIQVYTHVSQIFYHGLQKI